MVGPQIVPPTSARGLVKERTVTILFVASLVRTARPPLDPLDFLTTGG